MATVDEWRLEEWMGWEDRQWFPYSDLYYVNKYFVSKPQDYYFIAFVSKPQDSYFIEFVSKPQDYYFIAEEEN